MLFTSALKPRCAVECDVTNDVRANVTSRHGGFISSHVSGWCHGGRACPLVIRAEPGQRLSVTLWNFSVDLEHMNASVRSVDALVSPHSAACALLYHLTVCCCRRYRADSHRCPDSTRETSPNM